MLVARRELLAHGVPVTLGQRAFDVLLLLVSRRGQLVTKDELMAEVWPGVVVEENNIQVHVSALRKLLALGRRRRALPAHRRRARLSLRGAGGARECGAGRDRDGAGAEQGAVGGRGPRNPPAGNNLPQQLDQL